MAEEPATTAEPEVKKFTQAQIDEMIESRLSAERRKYADYDDIKARAQQYDELEQQNATELEKALKRAEKAEKAAEDATRRFEEATVRSAVIAEASKQGAVDPDVVAQLVDRGAITIDGEKAVGADKAVEQLLESKAFLKGQPGEQPQPGPVGGGPMPNAPTADPETAAGNAILGLIAQPSSSGF